MFANYFSRKIYMAEQKLSKGTQEKISELQLLQQRLTVFNAQRQQFQMQLVEADNALSEIEKSKGQIYKLVGDVLIEKPASEIKTELLEKKEEYNLRIKALEKQENKIKEAALALQKEVQAELK